ncbi:MAG TPA: hypothetical protein VEK56_13690, partial [Vicinamibacterales bacterium]|nr:hypothetical protein [Vicinamibacterales bacterium]
MYFKGQRLLVACAIGLAILGLASNAFAQAPEAPVVTVFPDNTILITYNAPVPPPAGTTLVGTFNGLPIGPFVIGRATSVFSGGPIPPGSYTVQVVWGAGVASPVTSFAVGGVVAGRPGTTTIHPPVVTGDAVALSWDPIPNATTYDLEAVVPSTGQTLSLPVGQASIVVPRVPLGTYTVRVRGRNAFGVGPFSPQVLVAVTTPFRLRDLEISLTWNTLVDMDLHVIEPDGSHVWWRHPTGPTSALETEDNITGFGPETVSVPIAGAAAGVYQVFIVHYRGAIPTTSTIAITLGVGTPNAKTTIFTRQSSTPDATKGINVAFVDPRSGMVGEVTGNRPTAASDERESV